MLMDFIFCLKIDALDILTLRSTLIVFTTLRDDLIHTIKRVSFMSIIHIKIGSVYVCKQIENSIFKIVIKDLMIKVF